MAAQCGAAASRLGAVLLARLSLGRGQTSQDIPHDAGVDAAPDVAADHAAEDAEAGACPADFGDCDGVAANGCETKLSTSKAHCGACGHACTTDVLGHGCKAGVCTSLVCGEGFAADCTDAPGCETVILSSDEHCGGCDNPCPIGTSCQKGECCPPGKSNCDLSATTGCETDLASDPANCGACGLVCSTGQGCVLGKCQ